VEPEELMRAITELLARDVAVHRPGSRGSG
jgi:hypothetical protein